MDGFLNLLVRSYEIITRRQFLGHLLEDGENWCPQIRPLSFMRNTVVSLEWCALRL